jgi:hypothetical protein
MRHRRPCRRRHNAAFLRELQRQRLVDIAEGRAAPGCRREQGFLWTLKSRRPLRLSDFILPPLLFLAEDEMEVGGSSAS